MSDAFDLDDKILKKFLKALSGKLPELEIGVLGDKNARKEEKSNASIGLKHEFGQDGMPIRSFLRVPLMDNLANYLENKGAFTPEVLREVVKESTIEPWINKIGVVGLEIIADAFASGGFGKWKPSNMKYKKNPQTLVETQQLRESIDMRVK